MTRSLIRRIASTSFAWAIVLVVAFPLFWMVVTSVKPQTELFRRPPDDPARRR